MNILLRTAISMFFLITSTAAMANDFPGVVVLESKLGSVTFTHELHAFLEGVECTTCHHTEDEGNISQPCHQCHTTKTSGIPNARKAFHDQCIGCHKEDKKKGRSSGPTSECKACHVKK